MIINHSMHSPPLLPPPFLVGYLLRADYLLICVMSAGCQVSQGKGETVTVHRCFCKDYVILIVCILLQPSFVVLEVVLRPSVWLMV